jgi:hypothetical protein
MSKAVKYEGQKVIEFAQVPSIHFTGVAEGQVPTGQFPFCGSIQSPLAHKSGVSGGQPKIFGQFVISDAQEPSEHNVRLFGQTAVALSHELALFVHEPSMHLKGLE